MGNNREKKQIRIVDSFNCPIFVVVVVVVLGIDPIVSGLYLGNDHDVIYVLFENIVLSLLEIGADGLVPHPRYATQFHRLISPAAIFFLILRLLIFEPQLTLPSSQISFLLAIIVQAVRVSCFDTID